MLVFPVFSALTGCASFSDSVGVDVETDLADMDINCDAIIEDGPGPNGERIVADTLLVGDMCRARGYASISAIDWASITDEIPSQAGVSWTEFVASINNLQISTNRSPNTVRIRGQSAIPAGVEVRLAQLVATASGKLADYEAEGGPMALVDSIGTVPIEGSKEYVLGFQYTFDGTEGLNLADEIDLTINEAGPLDTLNASYDTDPDLWIVTVASVDVPLEYLDTQPTDIIIDISQDVEFTARIRIRLFGGGKNK